MNHVVGKPGECIARGVDDDLHFIGNRVLSDPFDQIGSLFFFGHSPSFPQASNRLTVYPGKQIQLSRSEILPVRRHGRFPSPAAAGPFHNAEYPTEPIPPVSRLHSSSSKILW